jgi:hypothetical protein
VKVPVRVDGRAAGLAALVFAATRAGSCGPRGAAQRLDAGLPIPGRAARVAVRNAMRS